MIAAPGNPAIRMPRRFRKRQVLAWSAIAALLVGASLLALFAGEVWIPFHDVLAAGLSERQHFMIVQLRLPRLLTAAAAGAAFGVAGSVFQNVTRNPLGSPDILGMTAGSGTGALLAITVLKADADSVGMAALVGSVAAAAVLLGVAGATRYRLSIVILVGVGLSSIFYAVNSWLVLRADPDVAFAASRWLIGTTEFGTLPRAFIALSLLGALGVAIISVPRWLSLWVLDDRQNASVGANPQRMALALLCIGIVGVAIGVWAAGPLSMLSLMTPQLARRILGTAYPPLYTSALVGALILITADVVCRTVLQEGNAAVGSVTLVVGGAYMIVMLSRHGSGSGG